MDCYKLLAGNVRNNHVYMCPSAKFHVRYRNVEFRFSRDGFMKLSEVLNDAQIRLRHDNKQTALCVTLGFVTLTIPKSEIHELADMVNQALSAAYDLKHIAGNRRN